MFQKTKNKIILTPKQENVVRWIIAHNNGLRSGLETWQMLFAQRTSKQPDTCIADYDSLDLSQKTEVELIVARYFNLKAYDLSPSYDDLLYTEHPNHRTQVFEVASENSDTIIIAPVRSGHMTAYEANRLSESNQNHQINEVKAAIKKAAESGAYELTLHSKLTYDTIKELTASGYSIQNDKYNGVPEVKINWLNSINSKHV